MDPNLTLLSIALLNAFTAFMAWRTHLLTKQVEVATNSMKDALVKATGEASHAAGKEEGRVEAENKAGNAAVAILAEGKQQAKPDGSV